MHPFAILVAHDAMTLAADRREASDVLERRGAGGRKAPWTAVADALRRGIRIVPGRVTSGPRRDAPAWI